MKQAGGCRYFCANGTNKASPQKEEMVQLVPSLQCYHVVLYTSSAGSHDATQLLFWNPEGCSVYPTSDICIPYAMYRGLWASSVPSNKSQPKERNLVFAKIVQILKGFCSALNWEKNKTSFAKQSCIKTSSFGFDKWGFCFRLVGQFICPSVSLCKQMSHLSQNWLYWDLTRIKSDVTQSFIYTLAFQAALLLFNQ